MTIFANVSRHKKHFSTDRNVGPPAKKLIVLALTVTLWSCNYNRQKSSDPGIQEKSVNIDGSRSEHLQRYSDLHAKLFKPHCLSCHNAGQPSGGVNLETYEDIVNSRGSRSKLPILVFGKPQESSLFTTVVMGQMPPGPPKPDRSIINLLADWIEVGVWSLPIPPTTTEKSSEIPPQPEPQKPNPPHEEPPELTDPPVSPNPQPLVSFVEIQDKVIDQHCIYCHEKDYASGEIYLERLTDLMNPSALGKDPLVKPGDLKNSLFYQSIIRSENRMPPGDKPLPQDLIDLVKNWIETGAAP